jgi:hypothetical protein
MSHRGLNRGQLAFGLFAFGALLAACSGSSGDDYTIGDDDPSAASEVHADDGGSAATADAGPDVAPPRPDGSDAGPTGPTWTQLYEQVFGGLTTPGHCAKCHAQYREKDRMYADLVARGLVVPGNPAATLLATSPDSPLSWFGGTMPRDNPVPNQRAAEAVIAWVRAGAQNN